MIRAAKLGIALGVTMALAETLNLISPYKPLPKTEHAMTPTERCKASARTIRDAGISLKLDMTGAASLQEIDRLCEQNIASGRWH